MSGDFYIGVIYIAGLLSFFSPCIFPLLPIYLGLLSNNGRQSILKTFVFILGLSVSFVLLGFGAGSMGLVLTSKTFRIISGIFIVLFGAVQAEIVKIPLLERTKLLDIKKREENTLVGAFMLGFSFSLGWTPCVGPILGSIFLIASDGGISSAIFLMLIYVMGLATPFLVFTFLSNKLLMRSSRIKRALPTIKRLGGILIIIMGVLFLTDKLGVLII